MQKLKFASIPICIGTILLLVSWYLSYPVQMDSPHDFIFNHFPYIYWIGVALLFASFFTVAMKTESTKIRLIVTIGTFFLMFSQAFFYYMIPGSDSHQFRGLTEYFISTGNINSQEPHHEYFQWPVFFLLNKTAVAITGLDQRIWEFIVYGLIGSVTTSFIYLYIAKIRKNAYISVVAFFIILLYLFNFQFWSSFGLSFCFVLLMFHLDSLSGSRKVTLTIIALFTIMTFTHILTPLFFIVYTLIMYILSKNKKHLTTFIATSIIYFVVQINLPEFFLHLRNLSNFSFFQYFMYRVVVTTSGSTAPLLFAQSAAQLFSRIVVFGTALFSFFGFIILLRRRKFRKIDYAMLATGLIFAATLVIAPNSYSQMSNRSYFLLCIPISMGASYLCEIKLKKLSYAVFMILLVLFTFVLINQAFYDDEIFFQTKSEYKVANFMIDTANWSTPAGIFSTYRFEQYLSTKASSETMNFGNPKDLKNFPADITRYNFIVYTIGLAKSIESTNYTVQESFDAAHFSKVYSSNEYYNIYYKTSTR